MESIVKTILPLHTWKLQKAAGPVFTQDVWRAIALSLVPPSDSIVKTILKQCAGLDGRKLLSPSYRRWVRNRYKHYIKRLLHNNPYMVPIRKWLLSQRQKLEAQGGTADPSRIRKLREIEAETNNYFQQLIQTEQLPEELTGIVRENPDALNLLWEFAVYGEGGNKPKLRPNSGIWNALGLDPGQIEGMSPVDGLIACLDRFMALFGLAGEPPDEPRIRRLMRWVVRTHLPPQKEPETTPEARAKAVEAGLIHRGIVTRDEETGEVIDTDVEDTTATQFVHEVEENNVSEAERRKNIIELLRLKGVEYDDLTPREWEEIFERDDLFRKGYEFSSKTGVSISSFYGTTAHAKEQRWSRMKKRIRKVHR